MDQKQKLEQLLARAKKSTAWKDQARYELENEHWMNRSFAIALVVLKQLKAKGKNQSWLAQEIGYSRQYLSKILKGRENLTLETIGKLEQALDIPILDIKGLDVSKAEYPLIDKTSRQNQVKNQVKGAEVSQDYKMEVVYANTDFNQDQAA